VHQCSLDHTTMWVIQFRPETDLTKREYGRENDIWSSIY